MKKLKQLLSKEEYWRLEQLWRLKEVVSVGW